VEWILNQMVTEWGGDAAWQLDKNPQPHEARFLKLDCSKAKAGLNWCPKWAIEEVIHKIFSWQVHFNGGFDMKEYTLKEIETYTN
jgi:CDP-glucose 4,6-dehydratase